MRLTGVLNRDGGTLKSIDVDAFAEHTAEVFRAHGHEIDVRVVRGADLIAELKRAAHSGDALLAGGGDGTVSAAAAVAFEQRIPLAVLPAGTMNLFARSLGIPLGLDTALEALADGVIDTVDIATANGQPFVHQFSVGIHPKLVRLRETRRYRGKFGKMAASVRASLGVLFNPPNFLAEIDTPQGRETWRVAGLSVSNNPLDEGHLPLADHLDRGVLGLYLIKPLSFWTALRLALGLLLGKFRSLPEIVDRESKQVTLRFPRKKVGALAVSDGELLTLADRVDVKIHPGALKVLLPRGPASVP